LGAVPRFFTTTETVGKLGVWKLVRMFAEAVLLRMAADFTGGTLSWIRRARRVLLCWIFASAVVSGLTSCEKASEPSQELTFEKRPTVPTRSDCDTDEIFAGDAPMRLLTRYEYDNTIRDLLGFETTVGVDTFPKENAVGGLENNVTAQSVSALGVRRYMLAAESLAIQYIADRRDALVICNLEESACVDKVIEGFLRRAFRRPPTEAEALTFRLFFDDILELSDRETALTSFVEGVLQSPQFLYRSEMIDDGTPGTLEAVGAYALANRLSYFLWSSMPDEELFELASRGELETEADVEDQVRRMLADRRARQAIRNFYRQWLGLDVLRATIKDESAFPGFKTEFGEAWITSILHFVEAVHENEGNLEELMTSSKLYLPPDLATFYGYQVRDTGAEVEIYDRPGERAGLLTQPGMMALMGYPNQSSPIHRGVFLREHILCQPLPAPPDMSLEAPEPDLNATTRERFAQHTESTQCAGCHSLIDPLGFGFENFDGAGGFRAQENGSPIDASGEMIGAVDVNIRGDFDSAVALMPRLAVSWEVADCIADTWFAFAMGRLESEMDLCALERIKDRFIESDGSFQELMVAVAMSDVFRYRTIQVGEGGGE
jgi:hypothetical protein